MKKVLFVFAIAAAFAACNDSSKSAEAPKADSVVAAAVDTAAKAAAVDTAAKAAAVDTAKKAK